MSIGSDDLDKCYDQYIYENYYGSGSEPISFDQFLEAWDDMPEESRNALRKRAGLS